MVVKTVNTESDIFDLTSETRNNKMAIFCYVFGQRWNFEFNSNPTQNEIDILFAKLKQRFKYEVESRNPNKKEILSTITEEPF